MASDTPEPRDVPGLPPEVLTRIVTELAPNGHTILEHLRTAAALIAQARTDPVGLPLAESAAYNLREALDRVVEGRPQPQGGVGTIVEAWERCKLATVGPGASADVELARAELDAAIQRLAEDQERQAYKTQKLLEYVRRQTGIEPLPGEDDPTVRYSRLRARANATLQSKGRCRMSPPSTTRRWRGSSASSLLPTIASVPLLR